MARVHLLDDELINKIAAGEVVERPASVVKELVENAIDAGASQITVSLKDGGRQSIEVTDDGLGMDPIDAVMALKRHTTSKLSRGEDLFQITTMGFRGEALASISSVSRFTLQTRTRDSSEGTRIEIDDGKAHVIAWQGHYGSSFVVRDLFYNVPARKGFLNTGAAEFAACYEYLLSLALSLPQVGFRLVHNDREIFAVSPLPVAEAWPRGESALRFRAQALLGEELVAPLLYIQKSDRYAKVEALVSPPGQEKATAKHIYTFVNNRWVRDKTLRFGILRGYHSHLLKGKFPIVLMHCDIEPSLIDVNVHPNKAELRFQYGSEVQNVIASIIRDTMRQGAWSALKESTGRLPKALADVPKDFDLMLPSSAASREPELDHAPPQSASPVMSPRVGPVAAEPQPADRKEAPRSESAAFFQRAAAPKASLGSPRKDAAKPSDDGIKRTRMSFDAPVTPEQGDQGSRVKAMHAGVETRTESRMDALERSATRSFSTPVSKDDRQGASVEAVMTPRVSAVIAHHAPAAPSPVDAIPWDELQYVGVFQKCFLFFEHQERMLVIDQHAFHERVLYERLTKNPELLQSSQPLLMPEVLEFSASECAELSEKADALRALGLDCIQVSTTELELRAVPTLLINKDIEGVFQSILGGSASSQELMHDVLATIACHAAVRAGEDLPEPELRQLLAEARSVDFFHNCPHGRRVLRWWKASQVASWFDR